jgi:hypothetical protein
VPQKRKLFEHSWAFPGHRVAQMFSQREFDALCSFFHISNGPTRSTRSSAAS